MPHNMAMGSGPRTPKVAVTSVDEGRNKMKAVKPKSRVVFMPPEKRISDMNLCFGNTLPIKQIKKGQVWKINAFYDFDLYGGMKGEGGLWEKVMGINYVYYKKPIV
jgi:hypothetical protein